MIQNFFVQKLMIHNFLVQKSNNLLLLITIIFLAFFWAFCIFIYVYGMVSIESAVSGTLDNDIFDCVEITCSLESISSVLQGPQWCGIYCRLA